MVVDLTMTLVWNSEDSEGLCLTALILDEFDVLTEARRRNKIGNSAQKFRVTLTCDVVFNCCGEFHVAPRSADGDNSKTGYLSGKWPIIR